MTITAVPPLPQPDRAKERTNSSSRDGFSHFPMNWEQMRYCSDAGSFVSFWKAMVGDAKPAGTHLEQGVGRVSSKGGKGTGREMFPSFQLLWFGWGGFPCFYWIIVMYIMEKATAHSETVRGNGKTLTSLFIPCSCRAPADSPPRTRPKGRNTPQTLL